MPLTSHLTACLCLLRTWPPSHTCPLLPGWLHTHPSPCVQISAPSETQSSWYTEQLTPGKPVLKLPPLCQHLTTAAAHRHTMLKSYTAGGGLRPPAQTSCLSSISPFCPCIPKLHFPNRPRLGRGRRQYKRKILPSSLRGRNKCPQSICMEWGMPVIPGPRGPEIRR